MPTVGNKKYPYTKKGIADAKKASSKKAASKPLTAYQKAVKGPAKSAAKGKLKPYDAKWKAGAAKKGKRTGLDKFAEKVIEYSPLGGITYAAEAVTGKNMRGAMNKPAKKTSRLGAAGNAALYAVGGGSAGKAAKKTVKTLRATKGAAEMVAQEGNSAKPKGKAVYDAYVNELVAKEIAKMNRAAAKGKKK
jgi:hypothetical protein